MDLTKTIKDALERLCDLAEYGGGHPLDKKAAKIIRKEFLKGESSWRPAPADIQASITARLDEIAGELEAVDPRLALAVDQVSDSLEGREAATFLEVRKNIFDYLKKEGWTINEGLKIPYAVSPHRDVKLWFKSQSVHGVAGQSVERNPFESAHSWTSDIREYSDPKKFMELIEWWKSH